MDQCTHAVPGTEPTSLFSTLNWQKCDPFVDFFGESSGSRQKNLLTETINTRSLREQIAHVYENNVERDSCKVSSVTVSGVNHDRRIVEHSPPQRTDLHLCITTVLVGKGLVEPSEKDSSR